MATKTKTLPTRQQRDMAVAVMRDVIARIEAPNPLNITSNNCYLYAYCRDLPGGPDADLRDLLPAIEDDCRVCMLGAALLSKARLYDGVPAGPLMDRRGIISAERGPCVAALGDVFSEQQLGMIEAAFERTGSHDPHRLTAQAQRFGSRYPDSASRALAIARNVIANDGVFVP